MKKSYQPPGTPLQEFILVARYIILLPAALTGWFLAILIGLEIEYFRVVLLCPENLREGADCYQEGWEPWPVWLMVIDAAIASALIVWSTALVAPARKLLLGGYAFFAGALVATLLAVLTGAWPSYIAALAAGIGALRVIQLFTGESFCEEFPWLTTVRNFFLRKDKFSQKD